jgi:fucose 4-O-acetylase-like acetyltransferase
MTNLAVRSFPGAAALGALPPPERGVRRIDIDALRGLAIVLVVVGHAVAREIPPGNDWYWVLKNLIYRFHMPLFMVLAGITFGMSVPMFRSWREVGAYSWRKSLRLAVPYFVFGLAIIAGKLVAARFVHVDNPPDGSFSDVAQLLLVPARSAAGFLWFIYVLAIYLLAMPALLKLLGRRPAPVLLASILLQAFQWPEFLMLDRVIGYLPFYCFGVWACLRKDLWSRVAGPGMWAGLLLVAALLATALQLEPPNWVIGAASVPALLALMQRLGDGSQAQFWARLGVNSMPIYLMNTIVIGVAKGLMFKVQPWDGPAFLVYFPVLVFVGCAVPMVIKRIAERHAPRLAAYL